MMKSQLVLILCVPLCVMGAGPVTDLLVQNTGTLAPRLAAQIILEYDCIIRLGVDIVISPCQLIIIISLTHRNPREISKSESVV